MRFIWLLLSVGYHILPYLREKRLSNDAKAEKRALDAKKQVLYGSCFFGFTPYCSLLILFCIISKAFFMNVAREMPRSFNHASISANVSLRRRTENEV